MHGPIYCPERAAQPPKSLFLVDGGSSGIGSDGGGLGPVGSDLASANNVTLVAESLVPNVFGFVAVAGADTWNIQVWYRDSAAGSPTSNFTQGLEIAFQ